MHKSAMSDSSETTVSFQQIHSNDVESNNMRRTKTDRQKIDVSSLTGQFLKRPFLSTSLAAL